MPWLCCGSGMPSRYASVGARSIVRARHPALGDRPSPPARNVARMLTLRGQVLHVRHVAVLAEEVRGRDQRARRRGVELVRRVGEDDQVTGPGRVRHVGGRAGPVRDVPGLGLGEGPVDHLPALGLAVVVPVVGVGQAEERGLDRGDRRRLVGRGDLRASRAAGRVAAGEVEVDLQRAAGPAGLGLADRLAGGGAAVGRLRLRQQAEVDQHLAGVDRQELRREPVVGADEGGRVASWSRRASVRVSSDSGRPRGCSPRGPRPGRP